MPRYGKSADSPRRPAVAREGFSWIGLLAFLVIAGAIAGAGSWYAMNNKDLWNKPQIQPVTHPVERAAFTHFVTESGEVESSSNIEVRCEVQSRNTAGTAILEIVPEGTIVKKGDLICRLDKSALENEYNQQRIVCNTSEATVIKARSVLETAKIAKREYLEGTYKQNEQTILAQVAVAEENLSRAQDYVQYSYKLAAKGYVTQLQLKADEFAVETAKMDLEAARTSLDVLRNYTKPKTVTQLDADIQAAEATLRSEESTHALDMEKLALMEAQIKRCEIVAPADGQVVYANQTERRSGSEVIIDQGTLVREQQIIVRLPDPHKIQVKTRINESRIDLVREGMVARIRLDAFPDEMLTGRVRKVDDYPTQGNWYSTVKEYMAYVEVVGAPVGRLRPGMTAQVQIYVEHVDDALQIPVQAVLEHGTKHYCLVSLPGGKLEPKEVEVGSTNDKTVVVRTGLSETDVVVVNPRKYIGKGDLPEISRQESQRMLAGEVPKLPETAQTASTTNPETQVASTATENGGAGGGPADGDASAGEGNRRRRQGGQGGPGGGMAAMAQMDPAQLAGMIMQRMDTDQDGKLSKEETAAAGGRMDMSSSDTNGDGFVDQTELQAAVAKMRANAQAGGGGVGGGQGGGPGRAAPDGQSAGGAAGP